MKSNLDVDGLGDVVGEKRGVTEVGGVLLVLAPLTPGRHNVGVPKSMIRCMMRCNRTTNKQHYSS